MNIYSLSGKYQVRRIEETDLPALLQLCQSNPLFYEHCPPKPTQETLMGDLQALPPRKTMQDKYYLGFWNGDRLIAALDLILRFPNDETAFIGFFMLHKRLQGTGTASAIIQDLFAHLRTEFRFVRLGYVQTNEQSRNFWRKQGFEENGAVSETESYTIVYMNKALQID
ncbi:MAG: GNAT family N-acetyltransferase [Clostridia bacterium]|nr:GNAT family N-acetyltransferase [Clostridia bacterium]